MLDGVMLLWLVLTALSVAFVAIGSVLELGMVVFSAVLLAAQLS